MCTPASFIVTKEKVFWSKRSDAHEDIIKDHKLCERVVGKITFTRVEITPPSGDFCTPLANWQFRIDQDVLPAWWDVKDAERRVRAKLPEWLATCVHLAGYLDRITDKSTIRYIEGGTVEHIEGGTVEHIWGGTVESIRGGTVEHIWGGTVESIEGTATVTTYHLMELPIAKDSQVVWIDRSGKNPICRIGGAT